MSDGMSDIEHWAGWLEALAVYLSREERFTTDKTMPHGHSTAAGLLLAANDYRGAVAENKKLRAELHFAGERIRERDRGIEALRIENARLSTRRGQ